MGYAGRLIAMLPLLLVFVVFYFFLIRPQSKRQKEHKEMVSRLAVGDEVVTTGGVLGRITERALCGSPSALASRNCRVGDEVSRCLDGHVRAVVAHRATISG